MGAQLVREVASKTSDKAGDGTTTATVLAQAIVREGAKAVAAGMNPMDLKRGIDLAVGAVVDDLKKRAKKISSSAEVAQVGTISANGDREIGDFLARAMEKVGNEGVITVEEAKGVAAGSNPMSRRGGVVLAGGGVVEDRKRRAKKISASAEGAQVGTISANGDREIGDFLARAMEKVGNEGVITVEEAKGLHTELDVVEGMQFDRGYLSPYFVTNAEKMQVELENPYIIVHEKKLSGLQAMMPVLEAEIGRASCRERVCKYV